MKIQIPVSLLITMLLALQCRSQFSLTDSWPRAYYPNYHEPVKGAFIVMSGQKDTLKGYVKFLKRSYYAVIPIGSKWSQESIINVEVESIQFMKVFENSIGDTNHFSAWERLGKGRRNLWRLIGKKDGVRVYDWAYFDGSLPTRMLLVTPHGQVYIYHCAAIAMHFGHRRSLLLKFIRRRYKVAVRKRDFAAESDLVNYILDKENADNDFWGGRYMGVCGE